MNLSKPNTSKSFMQVALKEALSMLSHGDIINAVFSEKEPIATSDELSILWFKCPGFYLAEFRLIKVVGDKFIFHHDSTNLRLQDKTITINDKEYNVENVYIPNATRRLSPFKIKDAATYISKLTEFSEEFIYNTLKDKLFTKNYNEAITDSVDDVTFKFSECMVFNGVMCTGEEEVLIKEHNGWHLYSTDGTIKKIVHFTNELLGRGTQVIKRSGMSKILRITRIY